VKFLLSVLFTFYTDTCILVVRFRKARFGCRLPNELYDCLMYADDFLLLINSVSAMRFVLHL